MLDNSEQQGKDFQNEAEKIGFNLEEWKLMNIR